MKWVIFTLSLLGSVNSLFSSSGCSRPCIGYTPQYYDLVCDCGLFLDLEFLYWYAGESGLPLALKIEVGDTNVSPSRLEYMDLGWDPGFRVGAGLNSSCDGWDLYAHYTYMRNTNSKSVSSSTNFSEEFTLKAGDSGFISPWINPFFEAQAGSIIPFSRVRGKWRLCYNVVDLEMGRKYWLSQCFNLRPLVGVRFLWTEIDHDLEQARLVNEVNVYNFSDGFSNKYWGGGLLVGLHPTWHFSSCFGLYGQAALSLMWGEFKARRSESFAIVDAETLESSYSSNGDFCGMQGVIDLGLGLRYENTYCCKRYRFTIDLGWEHHLLYNHVERLTLQGSSQIGNTLSFTSFDTERTDLGLGGFVLKGRFDF